eukprot:GHUV01046696.1.p1 GENE.GHUV01046696.1~~GHUV01046696.1.p1  ORF type:complete len:119 (-),score=16.57 GHUV01046696.1:40-396(-)
MMLCVVLMALDVVLQAAGHVCSLLCQVDLLCYFVCSQDVGRFRILGATLTQMPGWCSDLKYAAALGTSVWHLWRPRPHRYHSCGNSCFMLSALLWHSPQSRHWTPASWLPRVVQSGLQ